MFAVIVAVVPTGRSADYEAARNACREAGIPLLTEKASTGTGPDCPMVQALADATRANVDNNLFAVLLVGALALVLSLVVARSDGTFKPQAAERAKNFRLGFGVALGLWLAILFARLASLEWVIGNGHWIAAVLLFVSIFVVALANARRVEKEQSSAQSGDGSLSATQESLAAARGLYARRRRGDQRYILIARLLLAVAVVTIGLWKFTNFSLFRVEALVFLLFMAFWTAQTFELESRQKVILQPPTTVDRSSAGL